MAGVGQALSVGGGVGGPRAKGTYKVAGTALAIDDGRKRAPVDEGSEKVVK